MIAKGGKQSFGVSWFQCNGGLFNNSDGGDCGVTIGCGYRLYVSESPDSPQIMPFLKNIIEKKT